VRFTLTAEQRDFRDAVDAVLRDADGIKAARAWSAGDTGPGLAIWRGLDGVGLHDLAVAEEFGGSGFHPVELCVALERIGYRAAPGSYAESLAASVAASVGRGRGGRDEADHPIGADRSIDAGADGSTVGDADIPDPDAPDPDTPDFNTAALLTAAQLLGLGRAALDMAVAYAKQRVQFGRPIGEYQAVKRQLADALVGLEFARPLVFGAALEPGSDREVSAAKVAASEAAYRAARVALQVHGAIGYTDEYDLSVYFKKIRVLYAAWGAPAFHRNRVLAALA
jgi:alkylation response protein AidB-like acyl-CoA dehydrogenase